MVSQWFASMPRIGGRGAARAPCPNTARSAHWHGRDGTRPRKRLTSMAISHSCSDLVLFDRQQQCPSPRSQFRIPLQAYHVQRHRSPSGPEDGLAIDRYLRLLCAEEHQRVSTTREEALKPSGTARGGDGQIPRREGICPLQTAKTGHRGGDQNKWRQGSDSKPDTWPKP